MKRAYTHIIVVLDRSGSMEAIKTSTINGFNQFILEQQKCPGEATLTLMTFSNIHTVVYDSKNIKDIELLTDASYVPDGGTALFDATTAAINHTNSYINSLKDEEKPEKVICVIITDGEENSSEEFSREDVFNMIKNLKDNNQWQFVFIGANQDAMQSGARIGIDAGDTMCFCSSFEGTNEMYSSLSANLTSFRCSTGTTTKDGFFANGSKSPKITANTLDN